MSGEWDAAVWAGDPLDEVNALPLRILTRSPPVARRLRPIGRSPGVRRGPLYTMLGWVLLVGLPLSNPATNDTAVHAPARPPVAAGRVAVWSDRDDPYDRGDAARVYLSAPQAAHMAVFRVDTDGRIRVLFPREPWGDTWVRESSNSSRIRSSKRIALRLASARPSRL